VDIKASHIYNFMTKLYRQQAEVIQTHENVHNTEQGNAWHRKCKRLKPGGGQRSDNSIFCATVIM
jgi:hypothetical protein